MEPASDSTLSADDMRELARRRWSIENHGFRALDDAINSKHVWTRGEHAAETFEALRLMMILSFMLVVTYHAQLDPQEIWRKYRLRRMTLRRLADPWLMSLYHAEVLVAEAS
jgi:hypothetical protein